MRLRERWIRFMQGRYGADELYYCLFLSSIVFSVVSLFFGRFPYIYAVLYFASGGLLFWTLFRFFSRNITKRRIENQKYLRFRERWRSRFRLLKNSFREGKTHVFRRCKKCKATLRLPRKRGRHTVKCPCCQERFRVNILFGPSGKSGHNRAEK